MLDEPCLVCGKSGPSEECHWPRTRRYGDATLPMCHVCHIDQHWGRERVVEVLIRKAPAYWKKQGTWEIHADEYESWCSRRRYREATWVH